LAERDANLAALTGDFVLAERGANLAALTGDFVLAAVRSGVDRRGAARDLTGAPFLFFIDLPL
jgi:hypothetical protein